MDRRGDHVIDPALHASLSAFDDAALATLANPGLVRRAHRDVEEGKVTVVSAAPGRAEVEADGHRVSLDARGPGKAECACKSVAVCRHRLAAVIHLRSAEAGAADAATEPEAPADPATILAELDPERLAKWAGKPAWRAALELAPTAIAVEPSPNAIAVTFDAIDGPVRILRGQGFDGIVSKATKARAKAYHAAAVLAAMAHFGASLPLAASE
ncbi:MAG TPA: SWIM zinc finger family protein, partial [Erythrobacter sp.]|nr:SWIM zinc finger family protein [Erythrobacter sp.]